MSHLDEPPGLASLRLRRPPSRSLQMRRPCLFEGARLIAGDGSAAVENAAILVERGIITRIGRSGEIAAPAGAARIDLAGKTVMPALIAPMCIRASRAG